MYKITAIDSNNTLYDICVYKGKKLLFRLRDSYHLLPSNLDTLSKSLCPELGCKGSFAHETLTKECLLEKKGELLDYMKQDILLLGGIMLKAQSIYWSNHQVDIVYKFTLSSLSLTIFRTHYYDEKNCPIHIPSMNEDHFIRSGYYGGHSDAYIPYGDNLYYYDVNSLYYILI